MPKTALDARRAPMYHDEMTASAAPTTGSPRERHELAVADTWRLDDIYVTPQDWEAGCAALDAGIDALAGRRGTLATGAAALLAALQDRDALGQLAYRVYYFAALHYDQDQRDNAANGRRQRVQHLLARWGKATSWFNPELLAVPLPTVEGWMRESEALAVYRFSIEDLYRQQAHVLDAAGERLLALSAQFGHAADDSRAPVARRTRPRHRNSDGSAENSSTVPAAVHASPAGSDSPRPLAENTMTK